MSEAARVDLTMDQGADFAIQLYWTDNYDVPFKIGHPMRMEVRDEVSQVVMEFVSGNETGDYEDRELAFNSDLGLIQLRADADYTDTIPPGLYFYDLFVTYEDNMVYQDEAIPITKLRRVKLIEGTILVNGRVTQNV